MATGTQAWQRVTRNDQLLLLLLALVIGVAAGYGALVFRLLTAAIQILFLGHGTEHLVSAVATLPWWQVLLAPTVGGLLIGLLTRLVLPGRLPQGVADVMEASALRQSRMALNEGLGAAFVSAASIGCGASVGREDRSCTSGRRSGHTRPSACTCRRRSRRPCSAAAWRRLRARSTRRSRACSSPSKWSSATTGRARSRRS